MKQYYVYTRDLEFLREKFNVVYESALISELAIIDTDRKIREIFKVPGVYNVQECGTGKLCG